MWNLYRFDEYFTAQIYGYKDAKDYYDDNASLQFLETLERPALLINSYDDPFLGELCYPIDIRMVRIEIGSRKNPYPSLRQKKLPNRTGQFA